MKTRINLNSAYIHNKTVQLDTYFWKLLKIYCGQYFFGGKNKAKHLGRTHFSTQKRQLVYNEICLSSYVRPPKSMLVFDFVSSSLCFRSTNDCSSAFCHLYLIQNTFLKLKFHCFATSPNNLSQIRVMSWRLTQAQFCIVAWS